MERKSITARFNLSEEERRNMLKEIEAFYLDVRDEEVGIIGSRQILDFFLENLGNQIYNKALDDAFIWHRKISENIEADFYSLYKE